MLAENAIPRWNLEEYFPGLESQEFESAKSDLVYRLVALESTFEKWNVGNSNPQSPSVEGFDEVTTNLNEFLDRIRLLATYVNCFVDTDSRDEVAMRNQSEFDAWRMRLSKLRTRWVRWAGAMDAQQLASQTNEGDRHAFAVHKAKFLASKQMSAAEEDLAAELVITGSASWEKLYGAATSQIEVELNFGSSLSILPISAVRNLAYDQDSKKREAAFHAEIGAWKKSETVIASALNGIKGEFLTLGARRGWSDPMESALFQAHIDAETLDAMMAAARESFPHFRRYLRAKAKKLGYDGGMPWYGIFAPISDSDTSFWPYEKAERFIEQSFATYSPELSKFAREAFDGQWVDAEPRAKKADGGYCTSLRVGDSRIFMNYKPSFGSVSTLAHELGHAYHNRMLKDRTPLQRQTPMTLAETASIFCETIIRKAGLETGSAEERLAILEASIMGSCQIVVDISSRFLFEKSVFELRREREGSATEFCELMSEAQRQTYGDGLAEGSNHPYMWAAKPHYYDGGYCYYNYPYMFGLLFGLGLFSIYESSPGGFHERYDDLLSSTGLADAASCAESFGINIRSIEFWRGSLKQIESDIDRFVELVG